MCQPAAFSGTTHSERSVPSSSIISQPMGTMRASSSMAGAMMRVGGLSAGGGLVGLGVGVGVGGTGVGRWWVGDGSGGSGVTVQSGSRSGVGPLAGDDSVGIRDGRGVGAAASSVGVGGAVTGSERAVTASTTAPASVMTGSGGWLHRVQTPQPRPARISNPPSNNIPFERAGTNLFMAFDLISTAISCQAQVSYDGMAISRP